MQLRPGVAPAKSVVLHQMLMEVLGGEAAIALTVQRLHLLLPVDRHPLARRLAEPSVEKPDLALLVVTRKPAPDARMLSLIRACSEPSAFALDVRIPSTVPLACAVVQKPAHQTRRADVKVNAIRVNLCPDEDGAREFVQRLGRQMFPASAECSRRVPQPLLHRRIAFPIRDSGQEHQVLALAPSRMDWHSVPSTGVPAINLEP